MKSASPLKIAASLVRACTTTPESADAAIVLLVTPSRRRFARCLRSAASGRRGSAARGAPLRIGSSGGIEHCHTGACAVARRRGFHAYQIFEAGLRQFANGPTPNRSGISSSRLRVTLQLTRRQSAPCCRPQTSRGAYRAATTFMRMLDPLGAAQARIG